MKYQKKWLIFKEEDVGSLKMVMTDKDRVLQCGWTEIKSQKSTNSSCDGKWD